MENNDSKPQAPSAPNQTAPPARGAMNAIPVVPAGVFLAFGLLTSLFAFWGLANNMTDTLLATFKRIMSFDDGKTAWIQIVCYALGYGCFAIPGAMFIKRYTFKSGVLLGLGMYVAGTLLFFPACMLAGAPNLCYGFYLLAILITFAGLSVLETACNPYICALGAPETATRRLNFAQTFNPLGSISGVAISQMFILSRLNHFSADERSLLPVERLEQIRHGELSAISQTYGTIGIILILVWIAIFLTKMPKLKESDTRIDFLPTWRRLLSNRNYVFGVVAQFFYVGAQIATWSFAVRYCMTALNLDEVARQGGTEALRNVEPVSRCLYGFCEAIHLNAFIPKTSEQAAATFYILSLAAFIGMRFLCTFLMRVCKASVLLAVLAFLAILMCLNTAMNPGLSGVYTLIGTTGCMSLMFPTIFALGTQGLGQDTKMGGSGMIMAIAGAAVLTQIQGILSDKTDSIAFAYFVPEAAFLVVLLYAIYATATVEKSPR